MPKKSSSGDRTMKCDFTEEEWISWKTAYITGSKEFDQLIAENNPGQRLPSKRLLTTVMAQEHWQLRRLMYERDVQDMSLSEALDNALVQDAFTSVTDIINVQRSLLKNLKIAAGFERVISENLPTIRRAIASIDWIGMAESDPKELLRSLKTFAEISLIMNKIQEAARNIEDPRSYLHKREEVIDIPLEQIEEEFDALGLTETIEKYSGSSITPSSP